MSQVDASVVPVLRDPFMTKSRSPEGRNKSKPLGKNQVPVRRDPFMTHHLKPSQVETRKDPFMTQAHPSKKKEKKEKEAELFNLAEDPFLTHTVYDQVQPLAITAPGSHAGMKIPIGPSAAVPSARVVSFEE